MKKSISEYEEAYAKTHLEFWEEEIIRAKEDPDYPIDFKDNPQKKSEYIGLCEEEIKKYKDILYPEKKSFFNFFKKKWKKSSRKKKGACKCRLLFILNQFFELYYY